MNVQIPERIVANTCVWTLTETTTVCAEKGMSVLGSLTVKVSRHCMPTTLCNIIYLSATKWMEHQIELSGMHAFGVGAIIACTNCSMLQVWHAPCSFSFLSDINECASNNSGCDDVCSDSNGSYTCSCTRGLVLSQDSHACICKPVQSRAHWRRFAIKCGLDLS